MEKIRAAIAEAREWFGRLSGRERRLVSIAAGGVTLFLLFVIFISFSTSAASYRRRTESKLAKLREVQQLASSYRESEQDRQALERRLSDSEIRLMTFLEEKGTAAGLDIPTMNPKGDVPLGDGKIVESSVELTLTDVSLGRLHTFLSSLERGQGVVRVKFIRLEPRPTTDTVTAFATIATYRMKK